MEQVKCNICKKVMTSLEAGKHKDETGHNSWELRISMWNKLKEIWADILLFVALGWILAHLIMIKLYRQVLIQEPNPVILIAEIVVTALLICLAIERFIKDVK